MSCQTTTAAKMETQRDISREPSECVKERDGEKNYCFAKIKIVLLHPADICERVGFCTKLFRSLTNSAIWPCVFTLNEQQKRKRPEKMNDFTQYTRIYPSHWNHKQFYLYAFRLFWLKLRHIARYFFHPRLTVNRNKPSLSCFYFLLYYRYFYFTLFSIVFFFCLLLMEKLKLFFAVFSPVELMEKRGCKQRNRKPTIRLTIVKNKCTRKSTKKRVLFEWCVLCVGFRRVAGEN